MMLMREDVVIRLDEERQVLQLLVPKRGGNADELRIFYELPAEDAEAIGDSIEMRLGVTLLSFLSATYTSHAFGLDQYRLPAQNMEKGRSQSLRKESATGDVSAMYQLAMQTIAHGLRAKSKSKMERADRLLREAAAQGCVEAAEYLADLWPALKQRSQSFK